MWWLTWSHRYDLWGKVAAIVFVVLSTRFTLAWMDVAPAGATEDPRFMTAWFVTVGVAFIGWWFLFSPVATWLYTSRVLGLNVSWAQARQLDGLFSADRDGRWHTAGDLLMVRPEQRLEPLLARAEAARRDREGEAWRSLQLRVPGGVHVNPAVWLIAVVGSVGSAAGVALAASPWVRGWSLGSATGARLGAGALVGAAVWLGVTAVGRASGRRTLLEIVAEAEARHAPGR